MSITEKLNNNVDLFSQVVIEAVAGNARKGKSTQMNHHIELLSLVEQQSQNGYAQNFMFLSLVEGKAKTDLMQPPRGFSCRSGEEAVTQGIWMWSRPFLIRNRDGDEVVVILLDSEGQNSACEDNHWNKCVDAKILSITTLISSVLVCPMET